MKYYGFCKECGKIVEAGIKEEDKAQYRVFEAVNKRGYLNGWTANQFLARQVAKLMEELGEMAAEMGYELPEELQTRLQYAADEAKYQFDHGRWMDGIFEEERLLRIWKELTDIQVVVFCIATTVNYLLHEFRDVTDEAVEKAEKDIRRGVR